MYNFKSNNALVNFRRKRTSLNLNKAFALVNVKIKEMAMAEIPFFRDFVSLIKCDYCKKPFSLRLSQSY